MSLLNSKLGVKYLHSQKDFIINLLFFYFVDIYFDNKKGSRGKTFAKGWLANLGLSATAAGFDQGASGGGFVAEGAGSEHGVVQVVQPGPDQIEGVPGSLP